MAPRTMSESEPTLHVTARGVAKMDKMYPCRLLPFFFHRHEFMPGDRTASKHCSWVLHEEYTSITGNAGVVV
jgi:hypothetical protein